MIALTQEKREELNTFINASIEQRCTVYTLKKQRELEELRDQIALASLTAEPVLHAVDSDVEDKMYTALCNEHEDGSYPLFTPPPVPEIKLPDRDKLPGWARNHEDSLDWYESEIKRLNGWGE
ncbi:hypothetical protein [Rosenbergiella epipactidis]|uniref:hypothetical protein n=1 Tax=Rosenbergiella epipactidis TaxID=1544694 RepID=UPI001F4D4DC1|nr:hypothetical protein [Rosenbergiella epipactidis]